MHQYDDLLLDGFSYDVRVLNAPLEVMVHRKALAQQSTPARSGMLGHLLLESVERVLELRAAGVHAPAWRRPVTGDHACSCGVVILDGLTVATSGGHLDFVLLEPVRRLVAGNGGDGDVERVEVVCRPCAWVEPVGDVGAAHEVLAGHQCARFDASGA